MEELELWTIDQVVSYLQVSGPTPEGKARRTLSRWGVRAVAKTKERWPKALYRADQIKAAHEKRPGRGARTDLKRH
jgi:hypothetical protein